MKYSMIFQYIHIAISDQIRYLAFSSPYIFFVSGSRQISVGSNSTLMCCLTGAKLFNQSELLFVSKMTITISKQHVYKN